VITNYKYRRPITQCLNRVYRYNKYQRPITQYSYSVLKCRWSFYCYLDLRSFWSNNLPSTVRVKWIVWRIVWTWYCTKICVEFSSTFCIRSKLSISTLLFQISRKWDNCYCVWIYLKLDTKGIDWLIDCFTAHQHRTTISAKKRC